ncbi:MAG: Wzz/FepE/Etk N-terminal domain-containing protein [Gammaproteobacteria bacterium]
MQDKENSNIFDSDVNHDEVDLRDLLKILIDGKWIIVAATSIFSIVGVAYSLYLPNIYESRALLAPSSPTNQSGILQNYGGLANLAGIDIPEVTESNDVQALEKIKSLSFFKTDFLPYIFLPDLMAYKAWDSSTNESEYDIKKYDAVSDSWVRKFSFPQKKIPSAQESFNIFVRKHLSINIDNKNNFVTVKIKHQSPYIAKEWTKLLIDQINSFYREKDKSEAERASNYLNRLLAETNLVEIKEVIAALLQQETKQLTLIEANEFYVYEFIDPPAVMEQKSQPKRALICILAALLGGMLGVISVFVRHYIFGKK